MKFSVITANLNMLPYLKKCHASIMDQNVDVEHIIVDGGSTDGSVEWIKDNPNIISIIGKDKSMYDAINKGFDIAKGEYISFLNADEQLLPKSLKKATNLFDKYLNYDFIYGNRIVIDHQNKFLKVKKSLPFNRNIIIYSHFYISSCSTFFRRSVLDSKLRFNDKLISVGDADFFINAMNKGFSSKYINESFATFMFTGDNLSYSDKAKIERRKWQKETASGNILKLLFYKLFAYTLKLFSGYYIPSKIKLFKIYINNLATREVVYTKK
ncbi:MAG: glycosyltransferase [Bacteroidales bacterium]|nr:glycosyltransferase [Bacteroidales bacterium]